MKQREQPHENLNEDEQIESGGVNAVELLRQDHRKVQDLFEEFEAADSRSRQRIVDQALTELEIHAKLEEGLIYPAIREVLDEEDLMDEALEEHHAVKLLIKELRKMGPKDERYRAKFKVLAEMVKHHIEEEELVQKRVRSRRGGFRAKTVFAMAGNQNNRRAGLNFAHFRGQRDAIHARHPNVADDGIVRLLLNEIQRRIRSPRGIDFTAL